MVCSPVEHDHREICSICYCHSKWNTLIALILMNLVGRVIYMHSALMYIPNGGAKFQLDALAPRCEKLKLTSSCAQRMDEKPGNQLDLGTSTLILTKQWPGWACQTAKSTASQTQELLHSLLREGWSRGRRPRRLPLWALYGSSKSATGMCSELILSPQTFILLSMGKKIFKPVLFFFEEG